MEIVSPGSPENLTEQMPAALTSAAPPDLVAAYLFQALEWDAAHPLVDLTSYIDDPDWGLSAAELADFDPALWAAGLAGERRLAVPALGSGQVLFYNQTWAEQLGFTSPPATPAELEQQVCAAAQANNQDDLTDNDGAGGLILSTAYSPMLGWLEAFGAAVYDPAKATGAEKPVQLQLRLRLPRHSRSCAACTIKAAPGCPPSSIRSRILRNGAACLP